MSAVNSFDQLKIGPVTTMGIAMNTLHNSSITLLRLDQVLKANNRTVILFKECTQNTVTDAAQFTRLVDKGFIGIYTHDGKLAHFPSLLAEGLCLNMIKLSNFQKPVLPKVTECIKIAADQVEELKAMFKKVAHLFEKKVAANTDSKAKENK